MALNKLALDFRTPNDCLLLLNLVHVAFSRTCLVSWNCSGSQVGMYVCVCVCVSAPRTLITSGVIWCVIDRVQLVNQVSWLFPAFNYFIWHLSSIKWMAVAILTQHIMNTCQKTKMTVLATKGLPERQSASFIKVRGLMRSDAFKRRPAFSFTVRILA